MDLKKILLNFSRIKEMLPKEYGKSKGIDKKIKEVCLKNFLLKFSLGLFLKVFAGFFVQEHKRCYGLDELQAKFRYVQLCRSLKTYGVTFFLVKV